MKKTEPEYYPPVENLLDLIYEHYTENTALRATENILRLMRMLQIKRKGYSVASESDTPPLAKSSLH